MLYYDNKRAYAEMNLLKLNISYVLSTIFAFCFLSQAHVQSKSQRETTSKWCLLDVGPTSWHRNDADMNSFWRYVRSVMS